MGIASDQEIIEIVGSEADVVIKRCLAPLELVYCINLFMFTIFSSSHREMRYFLPSLEEATRLGVYTTMQALHFIGSRLRAPKRMYARTKSKEVCTAL